MRRLHTLFFVLVFSGSSLRAHAQPVFFTGYVQAPPGATIQAPVSSVVYDADKRRYALPFTELPAFPFTVTVTGALGGIFKKEITALDQLNLLTVPEAIIREKNPNPQTIQALPALCPRVTLRENLPPLYRGAEDILNHLPLQQLTEPDASLLTFPGKWALPYRSYSRFDGKNVLMVRHVEIRNDYEDNTIVDYDGPHPITGKPHVVFEGEGGFYANFHVAVFPYRSDYKSLDRQTLLHLANGKLKEIRREDLMPAIKTHSFIPGPFMSRMGEVYTMCEWGDTAHQAPVQVLNYESFAIWDWDYPEKNADHLIVVVWEGDEEDWMIQSQLIDPFYLTDDLVGIFEIRQKQTKKPLTLVNERGDFSITLQTGDL